MGPADLLPIRRKVCCGFVSPLKIHCLGRVWTRSGGKHTKLYTTEATEVHRYDNISSTRGPLKWWLPFKLPYLSKLKCRKIPFGVPRFADHLIVDIHSELCNKQYEGTSLFKHILNRSLGSSVGTMSNYRLNNRGSIPGRGKGFPLASVSRPALGSIQPSINWVPGLAISPATGVESEGWIWPSEQARSAKAISWLDYQMGDRKW
jgi:hypothetical protein